MRRHLALREPALRDRYVAQGYDLNPGTPEQFAAQLKEDIVRWGDVARRANIVN